VSLLRPIDGLVFYEDIHRYRLFDQWLAQSVTGVVGHDMPAKTRERIDATRHEWEPRGNTVHAALEAALLGRMEIGSPRSLPTRCSKTPRSSPWNTASATLARAWRAALTFSCALRAAPSS
jgi:hypothetical protein